MELYNSLEANEVTEIKRLCLLFVEKFGSIQFSEDYQGSTKTAIDFVNSLRLISFIKDSTSEKSLKEKIGSLLETETTLKLGELVDRIFTSGELGYGNHIRVFKISKILGRNFQYTQWMNLIYNCMPQKKSGLGPDFKEKVFGGKSK